MQPQKPCTERNLDNCNYELGIEAAITGNCRGAVKAIKELKSRAECLIDESAERFLVDFSLAYVNQVNRAEGRDMSKLPRECDGCRSNQNCYVETKKGYWKKEPRTVAFQNNS